MRSHVAAIFNGEYDLPAKFRDPEIVDIGANVGAFIIWALGRWGGHVTAYEPNKANFFLLKENVAYLGGRVTLINAAVRQNRLDNRLFNGKTNCGACSFFQLGEQEETWTEVNVVKPSSLPPADILKIDTEGCEFEILKEMTNLRILNSKVILLEYHRREDRRIIDYLLKDYTLWACKSSHPDRGILKYVHNLHSEG